MLKKMLAICFSTLVLLAAQVTHADNQGSFAVLFQSAMTQGKTGNGFAATPICSSAGGTTTCTSPYGGTVTQNYSQWTGSSGTAAWSYNNFTISVAGINMTINGSFTFNGTISQTGILNGSLTGDLTYNITMPAMSYGGYTIPATSQTMKIGLNATFSNGNATVVMSIDGKAQPAVTWSQTQLLGYLY